MRFITIVRRGRPILLFILYSNRIERTPKRDVQMDGEFKEDCLDVEQKKPKNSLNACHSHFFCALPTLSVVAQANACCCYCVQCPCRYAIAVAHTIVVKMYGVIVYISPFKNIHKLLGNGKTQHITQNKTRIGKNKKKTRVKIAFTSEWTNAVWKWMYESNQMRRDIETISTMSQRFIYAAQQCSLGATKHNFINWNRIDVELCRCACVWVHIWNLFRTYSAYRQQS